MPNFVKVDSKPFHPDTYVGPEHEDDFASGTHERDMGIKLRVENTVRWRWVKDKAGLDVRLLFPIFTLISGADDCAYRSVANPTRMPSGGQTAL